MRLYHVNCTNDKDRTLNDCKQARLLFKHEIVNSVFSSIAEKHKKTVIKLHLNLSYLLGIVSSTSKLDLIKLNEIVTETLLIVRELKWVRMNCTLHGLPPHLVELIVANSGWSPSILFEEALEWSVWGRKPKRVTNVIPLWQ